jgi:hypothetical protein
MNVRFLLSILLALSLSASIQAQDSTATRKNLADVGLVYPISTEGVSSRLYTNSLCIYIIYGITGNVTNVALAGFGTVVRGNAHGTMISGFFNDVRGQSEGVQAAGFLNIAGSSQGAQVAGFLNLSGTVHGLQAAGGFNKATVVQGVQVAGILNKARVVHGAQVAGVINIADSSDYSIGIINIIKGGEKSVDISVDETATFLAAFRSGGRVLYGIAGIGYNGKNNRSLYAMEAGIGIHIPVIRAFRVNAEATATTMVDFKSGAYFKHSLGLFPAYKFGSHVELFAGPTFNWITWTKNLGDGLGSSFLWSKTTGTDFKGLNFGASGGCCFIL